MIPAQLLLWVAFSFHMDPFTDLRAWAFGKSPWETRHSTRRWDPSPRLSVLNNLLRSCYSQPPLWSIAAAAAHSGWSYSTPNGRCFSLAPVLQVKTDEEVIWSQLRRHRDEARYRGLFERLHHLAWVLVKSGKSYGGVFLSVPAFNMISETGDASHELDPLSRTGLEPQPPLSDFTPVDQKHEWTGWLLR